MVENEFKKALFRDVSDIITKVNEMIRDMEKIGTKDAVRVEINNIGITLNNKLIELEHQFNDKGMSLYSRENEKLGFYETSFLGDAILEDFTEGLIQAAQSLYKHNREAILFIKDYERELQEYEKENPIRRLLRRITQTFGRQKYDEITEEQIRRICMPIEDYINIDKALWKYNLRDNIVETIVAKIKEEPHLRQMVELEAIPDLQKLGLSELIPELRKEIERIPENSFRDSLKFDLDENTIKEILEGISQLDEKQDIFER